MPVKGVPTPSLAYLSIKHDIIPDSMRNDGQFSDGKKKTQPMSIASLTWPCGCSSRAQIDLAGTEPWKGPSALCAWDLPYTKPATGAACRYRKPRNRPGSARKKSCANLRTARGPAMSHCCVKKKTHTLKTKDTRQYILALQ